MDTDPTQVWAILFSDNVVTNIYSACKGAGIPPCRLIPVMKCSFHPFTGVESIMIKRHTRTEQLQHIDAWKHSGLTKQDYCEQQGITISNFYY